MKSGIVNFVEFFRYVGSCHVLDIGSYNFYGINFIDNDNTINFNTDYNNDHDNFDGRNNDNYKKNNNITITITLTITSGRFIIYSGNLEIW